MFETKTIDELFLELSQLTKAKTEKELYLEKIATQHALEVARLQGLINEHNQVVESLLDNNGEGCLARVENFLIFDGVIEEKQDD